MVQDLRSEGACRDPWTLLAIVRSRPMVQDLRSEGEYNMTDYKFGYRNSGQYQGPSAPSLKLFRAWDIRASESVSNPVLTI